MSDDIGNKDGFMNDTNVSGAHRREADREDPLGE
jgi:hypothetical protein